MQRYYDTLPDIRRKQQLYKIVMRAARELAQLPKLGVKREEMVSISHWGMFKQ